MSSITDRELQTLFDRAEEAVRRSREIRTALVRKRSAHRHTASERTERRLVAEHRAAVLRAVPPLNG